MNRAEEILQAACVAYLRCSLTGGFWFRAGLEGVRLAPHVAAQARRAGMEPGWPDLQIVGPMRFCGFIELKRPKETPLPGLVKARPAGRLSQTQLVKREWLEVCGWPYAVARDLEELRCILRAWGVPLKEAA